MKTQKRTKSVISQFPIGAHVWVIPGHHDERLEGRRGTVSEVVGIDLPMYPRGRVGVNLDRRGLPIGWPKITWFRPERLEVTL